MARSTRRAQRTSFHGLLAQLVPRADRKAIIASVDLVAYRRAEFTRDGALVLDGEIRNAAPRIELIRRGKRIGRTDVETRAATATVIARPIVRGQINRGEYRAEKQPGAEFSRNQIGVLALPTETGGFGERLFHDGRGIDKNLDIAARSFDQPASKTLQPRLDDIVIVVAARIDRNSASRALLGESRAGCFARCRLN